MKKILQISVLLIFFMLFSFANSLSQSFELTAPENNPDIISCYPDSTMYESEPTIKNISDSDLNFKVSITPVHLIEGHKFSMCDMNTCYSEVTEYFVTPQNNFLAAGSSSGHSIYIYLTPYGVKGTTELKVRFFNDANPDDYVEYTVKYVVGSTDVNNSQELIFSLKNLMPNPANDFINLKFNTESNTQSEIKVYTENGAMVKTLTIPAQSNSFLMNTSDLINGRYYFIINSGNNNRQQGNFIISR